MLDELVRDVLADFQKEGDERLLEIDQVKGWATRAIICLRSDLRVPYELIGQNVSPIMPSEQREIWILRTKMFALEYLRARSAGLGMWKSGDKSADRREEAKRWGEDLDAVTKQYDNEVKSINPSYGSNSVRPGVRPALFERGSHPCRHHGDSITLGCVRRPR